MSLQTNLSAFWELENTSWTDALGVNNLTGTNSPTVATGVVGNAVNFTNAGGMFLSHANAAALTLGGATTFSFQVWINPVSGFPFTSFIRPVISKNDGGFGNREYGVGTVLSGTQRWYWEFYDASDNRADCLSTVAPTAGFHHLIGTWDGTTQKLYVDAGTATTNVPGISPITTTSSFMIGKDGSTGDFASATQDVLIDQVGLWKDRVLSAADVTSLYNGGSGLSFAAMADTTVQYAAFSTPQHSLSQVTNRMIGY